ncbi:bacillithiol system redox-active protein YtxJ [Paenibacillus aquistagni]|uniref:bacillithiol system redox-active protein YtxJ n=1 Tax=Paenibacillus aquistagni TaxID=1852522 RepID=UPI00145A9457|nr:bacillithiol system redox-active protein YtxJ [Paenibacillus aquistagni]NMM51825.1 bacillithiol system redox-active protein YtxJ [Paenibacillus aquistagni]
MSGLIIIQTLEQLQSVIQESSTIPVLLYKHSSQCGSSRVAHSALNLFINRYAPIASQIHIYVVRVLEEKQLSNQITAQFGIPHVSPQILFIDRGQVIWHASHQHINSANLYQVVLKHLQSKHQEGGTP